MTLEHQDYLAHHGIKGQKWGVRRYQNEDGTLTEAGKARYLNPDGSLSKESHRKMGKLMEFGYDQTKGEYVYNSLVMQKNGKNWSKEDQDEGKRIIESNARMMQYYTEMQRYMKNNSRVSLDSLKAHSAETHKKLELESYGGDPKNLQMEIDDMFKYVGSGKKVPTSQYHKLNEKSRIIVR